MGICQSSLLNQTYYVGWFLLKKFVDLVRVCYLHIISRNYSNTLLLINLQKTCPKQTGFCPLLGVYFNDKQINRWLYLSSSLQGISLLFALIRKRIDPKYFLFTETNSLIVLAVRQSVKYFFAPNSPIFPIRLPEKQEEEEGEPRQLQSLMRFMQTQ